MGLFGKDDWKEKMNDFVRFLTALFVTAIVAYVSIYILMWPAVMLIFMLGDGAVPLLVCGWIVLMCLVFFGVLKVTEEGPSPEQEQDKIAYQQRRTNMPPHESPATDLYNFQMLSSSYHMLQWLADLPYQHICQNIEQLLRQQMPDSRLLDIAATSMPQWQTVEVLEEENGQTVAISRTGMAFEFVLHVSGNGQTHQLTGVYTWAGSRLNRPPAEQRQRIWLDLNGTLADFGGSRMAERLKAAN